MIGKRKPDLHNRILVISAVIFLITQIAPSTAQIQGNASQTASPHPPASPFIKREKPLIPLNGLLPCVPMHRIGENPALAGVRYYGYYSNVARGKRKICDQDELIQSILEPVEDLDFSGNESSKENRKSWSTLIQNINELFIC